MMTKKELKKVTCRLWHQLEQVEKMLTEVMRGLPESEVQRLLNTNDCDPTHLTVSNISNLGGLKFFHSTVEGILNPCPEHGDPYRRVTFREIATWMETRRNEGRAAAIKYQTLALERQEREKMRITPVARTPQEPASQLLS